MIAAIGCCCVGALPDTPWTDPSVSPVGKAAQARASGAGSAKDPAEAKVVIGREERKKELKRIQFVLEPFRSQPKKGPV